VSRRALMLSWTVCRDVITRPPRWCRRVPTGNGLLGDGPVRKVVQSVIFLVISAALAGPTPRMPGAPTERLPINANAKGTVVGGTFRSRSQAAVSKKSPRRRCNLTLGYCRNWYPDRESVITTAGRGDARSRRSAMRSRALASGMCPQFHALGGGVHWCMRAVVTAGSSSPRWGLSVGNSLFRHCGPVPSWHQMTTGCWPVQPAAVCISFAWRCRTDGMLSPRPPCRMRCRRTALT
jgi:hypothetical protein